MTKDLVTERLKLKDLYPERAEALAKEHKIDVEDLELVRKGIVAEKAEVDKDERAVTSYINTAIKDRDNEIIEPEGAILTHYRKNPVVPYGHRYGELPVGKNIWIKKDKKGLLAKTIFAKHQFADEVYRLYSEDIAGTGPVMKAWSIGFIPLKWEESPEGKDKPPKEGEMDTRPRRTYKKWELLEYSAVMIPSNREALTEMVAKGLIKSEKLKKDIGDVLVHIVDRDPDLEDGLLPEASLQIVTKPEETEDYIRLPAKGESGKHKGHKIRWITVSAKEGIRGIYCIDCKKIISFVFDKKKGWTMEKAKKWMEEHGKQIETTIYKERWNKSLPKLFDISEAESPKPKPFNYELYGKFLDCKIKEIFKNTYSISSPLIGTYLAGLKEILSRFDLKDMRNFSWDGTEMPPEYAVIQLNSTQSDDFLMTGISFYDADGIPLIVKYMPEWNGFNVSFITSSQHKEWNKELLSEIHKWVQENNFLRGEKFSLSGEFLDKSEDGWDNLILKPEMKDILRKSVNYLMKKKDNLASRGLLFVGPPGTGKTKTGRVLMNKADATFIWVSSRDFRKVGPLNALTLSFSLARELAPTILFIEDIDTWLKEWGNQDSVVVDLLKTELDGIKQNKGIINVLTSNYPERLPDTLLNRPGRFHHIVKFELPQAEQRKEMLILWAGEIENSLLEKIVKEIEDFSGAHIKELVDYAYIIAEEDDIDIGKAIMKSLEKLREQRDLISEIRENKKSLVEILVDKGVIELVEKGVIPFKETPKAPEGEKWDGPREIREAEVSDLKIMCCWVGEDPDIKGSYKLPHHKAKGHAVVWRGVANCMAILFGARGGVDVPSGDRKGIYNHLSKEYKRFDKEPPEFREYTSEELECIDAWINHTTASKEAIEAIDNQELALNWCDTVRGLEEEEPKQTEREQQITRELFDRLTAQLNKVEEELKSLKEGRVLSAKNRKLVKQCADMLNALYEATEPPQREEFELEIENGDPPLTENGDPPPQHNMTLEIDNSDLTKNIASIIKNRIGEMVQSAINKARGKVE